MGCPVVRFEVMGSDGEKLRSFYTNLFGWAIVTRNPFGYGIVEREGVGIGGGVEPDPTTRSNRTADDTLVSAASASSSALTRTAGLAADQASPRAVQE